MSMLQPGDWINFQNGWDRRDFYVIARSDDRILVGTTRWLVSAAIWVTEGDIYSECDIEGVVELHPLHNRIFQGPPIYLGRGKKRWWYRFVSFMDTVHPYSKPSIFS